MCSVQELLDLTSSIAVILHLLQGLHHYLNCSELITSPQRIAHLVKCEKYHEKYLRYYSWQQQAGTRMGLGEERLPVGLC